MEYKSGTLQLTADLVVCDPCRKVDTDNLEAVPSGELIHLTDLEPGDYEISYVLDDWMALKSMTISHRLSQNTPAKECIGRISVDSGQAGIFDRKYFGRSCKSPEWYVDVSDRTIKQYPNPEYIPYKEYLESQGAVYDESKDPEADKRPFDLDRLDSTLNKLIDALEKAVTTPAAPDKRTAEEQAQANLFSEAHRNWCTNRDLNSKTRFGHAAAQTCDKGAVCSTGADGSFPVFVARNAAGKVTKVKIRV